MTIADIAWATQSAAANVVAARGLKSPAAIALLITAATAASAAMDADHPVHAIYPPRGTPRGRTQPRDDAETA
ncbi:MULTISPECIES: hypothetical protein [Streptomyces violaceusniger group]|uniref:Uncharacterized protein n=2 Tax=Streptomyces rhizosphaericus TaxID=114699 RepID=A0ABN1S601_9ACTN|nr:MULTISPECIES: hypothetical protein [Streptomyces violaceusniger group]